MMELLLDPGLWIAGAIGFAAAVGFMATTRKVIPLSTDKPDHPDIIALRKAIEAARKGHKPVKHMQRRMTDKRHDLIRQELSQ